MKATDDIELLRQYANGHSDQAFRELVDRHTNLVYSVALRYVHNPHLAEEVTQAVFIALAQKAGHLKRGTILAGWLFNATRFAAMNALRTENRRQHWLQEAARMDIPSESPDPEQAWKQLVPFLNEALGHLAEKDRLALLLRFFQDKKLDEVGQSLGITGDAAKMRVTRALEKLRARLVRRGVVLPVAVLAGALSAHATPAAPIGLSATVATVAGSHAASSTSATFTLAKGILKFMAWTKVKTAIIAGTGLLLVAGTATVTVTVSVSTRPSSGPLAGRVHAIIEQKLIPGQWNSGMDDLWALGPEMIPYLAAEAAPDTAVSRDYEWLYGRSPASLRKHLPAPVNRGKIRQAAMRAIAEFGPLAARRAAPQVIAGLSETDDRYNNYAARSIVWLLPESKQALVAWQGALANTNLLQGPVPWVLLNADDSSCARVPQVVPSLTSILANSGEAYLAAIALGRMGSNAAPAIPSLIQVADIGAAGSYPNVDAARRHKAEVKSNNNQGVLYAHLATVIQDDKGMNHNRAMAALALGRIGIATPEVRAALARAWNAPDHWVRQNAADAVALLGPPVADNLPDLLPGLRDSDNAALGSKLAAIRKLGPAAVDALGILREFAQPERLRELAKDTNNAIVGQNLTDLAIAAQMAICELAPAEGRPYLSKIANRIGAFWDPVPFLADLGSLSNEVIQTVEPMLTDASDFRQSVAAYIILKHNQKHPAALAVLQRNAATGALNNRCWAAQRLYETLGDTNIVRAVIVEALKSPEGFIRQDAVNTAEEIGDAALPVVPALKQALWDQDKFVRARAGNLLLKIAPDALPPIATRE